MRLSVITPTCDRPVGFAICERWMARQTRQPDEWIVADGGQTPVVCTQGQTHLHQPQAPGVMNFTSNVLRGVSAATGDILAIVEDDDWYHPTHLETVLKQLSADGILAAGDDRQRYYNVQHRIWHLYPNKGASLCQTAFKREVLPVFLRAVRAAAEAKSYGVDGRFWASLPDSVKSLRTTETVLGIKGLPGRIGLGVGHRPQVSQWNRDPKLTQLKAWVGPQDAEVYGSLWAHA